MATIILKGGFWTHFVGGKDPIKSIQDFLIASFDTVIAERRVTAITTVIETTTEATTGPVSTTTDTDNTGVQKHPVVALFSGAEIGLQNVIHKEVDSYANIVQRGATTPT